MPKQAGIFYVVDNIYQGRLAIELQELGLIVTELDTSYQQPIEFNDDDYLIILDWQSRVELLNSWLDQYFQFNQGTLAYQLRFNATGCQPQINCSYFRSTYGNYERYWEDPAIAALEIKSDLGLIPSIPDWDSYFMSMVYLVAMRSKDANTHIGAVVVDANNNLVTTGYNSFPRGINDHKFERQVRPEKYLWFNHAEYNAVTNASNIGSSLRGCRMYTNGIPCMERCAGAIINSGIIEVIVDANWNLESVEKWQEQAEKTQLLFKEAGINIRFWQGKIIKEIIKYCRGRIID